MVLHLVVQALDVARPRGLALAPGPGTSSARCALEALAWRARAGSRRPPRPPASGSPAAGVLPSVNSKAQRRAISTEFSSASGRSAKSAAISACVLKYCDGRKSRGRRASPSTQPCAMHTRASWAVNSSGRHELHRVRGDHRQPEPARRAPPRRARRARCAPGRRAAAPRRRRPGSRAPSRGRAPRPARSAPARSAAPTSPASAPERTMRPRTPFSHSRRTSARPRHWFSA